MKSYYLLFVLFIGCVLLAESVTEKTKLKYAGRCSSSTQFQKIWAYTGNATGVDDGKYASVSITKPSPELYCFNFSLSLPADAANISKINVLIRRYAHVETIDAQATPISDAEIQIKSSLQDGLLSLLPSYNWTEYNTTVTYGGDSNAWTIEGVWPNAAMVNAEGFGVSLSISPGSVLSTAFVDSIALRVSWIEKECGDGLLTGDEQCDGGVGCNATCLCEPGYVPTEPVGQSCRLSCGDGVINSDTEECDGGDGCSASCKCMDGYVSTDPPSSSCIVYVPKSEGETPYYLGPSPQIPTDNRMKYPIIIAAILLSVGVLLIFLCRKKCVKIDRFGRKDADIDDDEDGMTMNENHDHTQDLEDGDTYGADTGDDHDGDHESTNTGGVTLRLPIGSPQQQPNPDGDKNV